MRLRMAALSKVHKSNKKKLIDKRNHTKQRNKNM